MILLLIFAILGLFAYSTIGVVVKNAALKRPLTHETFCLANAARYFVPSTKCSSDTDCQSYHDGEAMMRGIFWLPILLWRIAAFTVIHSAMGVAIAIAFIPKTLGTAISNQVLPPAKVSHAEVLKRNRELEIELGIGEPAVGAPREFKVGDIVQRIGIGPGCAHSTGFEFKQIVSVEKRSYLGDSVTFSDWNSPCYNPTAHLRLVSRWEDPPPFPATLGTRELIR